MRLLVTLLSLLLASQVFAQTSAPATAPDTQGYAEAFPPERSVIYVIDQRTPADNFAALRHELRRSVVNLTPNYRAGVIGFSDTQVVASFPATAKALPNAILDTKRDIIEWLDQLAPATPGPDTTPTPLAAVEKALALKPTLICLLFVGNLDPQLPAQIATLNPDHKTRISTIGFVGISKDAETLLAKIAEDNGGKYKRITQKDLDARAAATRPATPPDAPTPPAATATSRPTAPANTTPSPP